MDSSGEVAAGIATGGVDIETVSSFLTTLSFVLSATYAAAFTGVSAPVADTESWVSTGVGSTFAARV